MDLVVEEKLQIGALVAMYCHALDSGDLESIVALFSDDAVFETSRNTFTGKESIRGFFKRNMAEDENERHFTSNHLISGGKDRAYHSCYYQVVLRGNVGIKATGVYQDHLIRVDEKWKFQHRKILPD